MSNNLEKEQIKNKYIGRKKSQNHSNIYAHTHIAGLLVRITKKLEG